MNANRVSLKTIADKAGVSVAAVSQILNNKPNNFSSEITKHKVRQIANAVGYRPNFGYKLMRGEKTKTVSIFIAESFLKEEDHINKIIIETMTGLDKNGYACFLSAFSLDANENLVKIRDLIARGVQYFVLLGSPLEHEQIEFEIIKSGKHYIGYNSLFKRTITNDSIFGAEAILRYFIAEGRNNFRLLVFHDQSKNFKINSRFIALKKVFPDVPEDVLIKKYVFLFDSQQTMNEFSAKEDLFFEMGYSTTAEVLTRDPHVQALFYQSDYFALGGAKFLLEKGFLISKDILVAGFNNTMAIKSYPFPISSVEHNIKIISQAIIKEIFNDQPLDLMIEPIIHIRK